MEKKILGWQTKASRSLISLLESLKGFKFPVLNNYGVHNSVTEKKEASDTYRVSRTQWVYV